MGTVKLDPILGFFLSFSIAKPLTSCAQTLQSLHLDDGLSRRHVVLPNHASVLLDMSKESAASLLTTTEKNHINIPRNTIKPTK